MPALLESISEDGTSSHAMVQVWRRVYEQGHANSPKIAVLTTVAFAYTAWGANSQQISTRIPMLLYSAAASLVVGIVPYTLIFIEDSNRKLLERAAGSKHYSSSSASGEKGPEDLIDQESNEGLLRRWRTLTLTRALLPTTAGFLGLLAITHYE